VAAQLSLKVLRLGMQDVWQRPQSRLLGWLSRTKLLRLTRKKFKMLLDAIEAEVKPQIMPFFACDCPRGHKGKWTHKPTGKVMSPDFDPLFHDTTAATRIRVRWTGSHLHVLGEARACQTAECRHRTPLLSSPVVTFRSTSIRAWTNWRCPSCLFEFDIEPGRNPPVSPITANHLAA
jgi:putative DNA methylase